MATDQEIIDAVRLAFAAAPRPEHFTDLTHCCECAEHDALLASRDVEDDLQRALEIWSATAPEPQQSP
jgi:hypothetical protein